MSYIGNRVTSSAFVVDVFSGTGSQTAFTPLSFAPAATASIGVFVAGSYQSPTSYTINGTTLTFNSAPAAGTNNIQVLHLGTGATTITVSDGSITAAKIAGSAVTGAKIASTTITGDKIAVGTLNANVIAASTITGDKIAAATIGSSNLTTTGVAAGTYGGTSNVSVITVDTAGRVTYAGNTSFSGGATITVDNTTNYEYLVGLSNTTSGTWTQAYVSNTKLYFNPSTGTLTATDFNSLSDITLKDNIINIESPISIIEKLSGVEFNWKDSGKKSSGFIAQEVEQSLPHLVGNTKDGIKTVNYQGVIAYLVETVKHLNNRIKQLENKNGIQD